ncbi:MAG: hypothetical protein Q7T79_00550 [bacterium]|nr:hypothetical protein [bacterium]
MKTKLLITITILLALLIGGYFMRNFMTNLFEIDNKTVILEWQSKSDTPNPWEVWQNGPLFEIPPTEKDLMELYYQDKFNPEKQILDYKYKKYKGEIILDYKQIEIQNKEDYTKNRLQWGKEAEKVRSWESIRNNRGLIIQIQVSKKIKNKFLEDGWKIVIESNQENSKLYKIEVFVDEDENDPNNINKIHIGNIGLNDKRELDLTIITEGKYAENLRKQVDAIKLKKTLKLPYEEFKRIWLIIKVLELKKIDINSDDPRYIFAVERELVGFETEIIEVLNSESAFAVYLLADKNISWSGPQSNLSEFKLASQPLFTSKDILSYNWNEHNFVLTDEAEKRITTKLTPERSIIDEIIRIPFVVMVKGERIYGGIFEELKVIAVNENSLYSTNMRAYREFLYITSDIDINKNNKTFYSFRYGTKNIHYLGCDDPETDPRNDLKIKQVLEEEGKLVFSDTKEPTFQEHSEQVELVVVFKKDITFKKADEIMKQAGFTYRQGSDSSRGKMYSQLTGPKFILKFPANKYIDIFRAESYRDIPEIYEIYQADWNIIKD